MLSNAGETLLAIGTLGVGPQDEHDDREEVLIINSYTGDWCFDWQRSLPDGTNVSKQHVAISPSSQFVAIAVDGELSIYQLPKNCSGSTK